MSYLIAAPEFVSAAATDLANIGETISQANATAASPTSSVLAAGADEVSAAISSLFGAHAQAYQALSTQAASFHQQFVRLLNGGAAQYAHTEAANAQQAALSAINSPVEDLTGRPLIGNGANGTATNPNGAAGDFCSATAATASPNPRATLNRRKRREWRLSVRAATAEPAGPAPAGRPRAATAAPAAPAGGCSAAVAPAGTAGQAPHGSRRQRWSGRQCLVYWQRWRRRHRRQWRRRRQCRAYWPRGRRRPRRSHRRCRRCRRRGRGVVR